MNIATSNAMKRSSIAEYLISNLICAKNYNESSLSMLRKCMNYCNLIKLEATLIKLDKPELCKQNSLLNTKKKIDAHNFGQ